MWRRPNESRAGDLARSRELLEEGLAVARANRNQLAIRESLTWLGQVEVNAGRLERSRELLEEAVARLGELGDTWFQCWTLPGLGYGAAVAGQHERAREHLHNAARLAGEVANPYVSLFRWYLALHAFALGDVSGAAGRAAEELLGTGVLIVPKTATVHVSGTSGSVMENAKVPPGASFGWHSHRTAIVVAITAGTLTLYDSSGRACKPRRYYAGQGFIEPADHLHMALNEGKSTVKLYATYIGVPASLRANPNNLNVLGLSRPQKCPASVQ